MNDNTLIKLGYNDIKDGLKKYCTSSLGKELVDKLKPSGNIKIVKRRLAENKEAKTVLENSNHVPLEGVSNIYGILDNIDKGMTASCEDLVKVQDFLRGSRKIKGFMEAQAFYAPTLSSYALNIEWKMDVEEEIERCIVRNKVDSSASSELKKLRRGISIIEDKIRSKLNKFLTSSSNKEYIQDFVISKREDRFVIPIKASYKHEVEGNILGSSSRGTTVFIEPKTISNLTNDLVRLKNDESIEEYKILCQLSELVYENIKDIMTNTQIIAEYDLVFAKAKYSIDIGGVTPGINKRGYTYIVNGKHPLLEGKVVPLNISIGKNYRGLLITGPNAGGKTVALKTVGLLTLMVQTGLDIIADKGTKVSIFDNIYVDIGDDQSIENALSTFSSHISNISNILKETSKSTLIICDEIGSGTEPNEGAALAIAILEEMYRKGAIILASTHYGEIKRFASTHNDFENAGMLFDRDTLNPLYKMVIGKSQNSNALYISKKMGIPSRVIDNAKGYIVSKEYDTTVYSFNNNIEKVVKEKTEIENISYEIGDRVYIKDRDDYGIIYKPCDKFNNVEIIYNNDFITIHISRISLHIRGTELYPEGYDLSTLFTSYGDRKLEKDIKRGSKKVLKKIHKDIRDRKS